ncbi:hypothetical protein K438DRAFT_1779425 [Mycena galopus ATCC 62051]|nr:hypothetical protein K438DRAFT_1779425 [Mycena galopus ATCC 62051]
MRNEVYPMAHRNRIGGMEVASCLEGRKEGSLESIRLSWNSRNITNRKLEVLDLHRSRAEIRIMSYQQDRSKSRWRVVGNSKTLVNPLTDVLVMFEVFAQLEVEPALQSSALTIEEFESCCIDCPRQWKGGRDEVVEEKGMKSDLRKPPRYLWD